ncbi:MAG TPA: NUDIX hydrolase [Holophagaceae bacterium]|nr:NUDIX hydrolase [Holophagaceae bacterium]
MPWSLTVAAIIERNGRFLFVEERDGGGPRVLNQPAGHVEEGEPLREAVIREVAEETGLPFTPEALVGIYQLRAPNGKDYVRVCFAGSVPAGSEAAPRDADILACHWLTPEELVGRAQRSALVGRCLDDWQAGRRLPLEAASTFVDAGPRP